MAISPDRVLERPSTRRTLIGSGAMVGAAVIVANGLNAIFQLALARIVEPADYSLIAALFTVLLVTAVPTIAFQASVAREVAATLADGDRVSAALSLRETLRAGAGWTLGLVVLTGLASGPLVAVLGSSRALPLIATSLTVAVSLGVPIVWGGLQGETKFLALSAGQIGFSLARLSVGLVIAAAGGGTAAIMFGIGFASAAAIGISLLPLRSLLHAAAGAARARRRLATLPNAAAAVALTALSALTTSDLLVAKLAFRSHLAGSYAAGSLAARVLLLLPVGVTTVLFPRVATLRDSANERRHLLGGVLAVAAVSAPVVALLWGLAGPILDLTFGSKYHAATPWLGPLSLAMALYAVAFVYVYHFLSLGRAHVALALVGLLSLQLVLFGLLHGSPNELIGVQIGVGAATLVVCELWYLLLHRRDARPAARA